MIDVDVSTLNDPLTMEGVYDVFNSDLYGNYPLPNDLTPEIWQNMTFLDDFYWTFFYGSPTLGKLMNFDVLSSILTDF